MTHARPARPRHLIERERLFRAIDEAQPGRALWVAAEAGSGKTALLTTYLESRGMASVWHRVSPADSDLATFFHYFGEAVRRARPRMARPLPHLTPEYLPNVAAFARRYFDQALGGLKRPATVVLDELQGAALVSPLSDIVLSAIEDLPSGVFLVVLSRAAPPPTFARLMTGSGLSLISADQMRFSEEEGRELAEALGFRDRAAIQQCVESSRGWAAGLVLLLQARLAGDTGNAPPSRRVLFDYFAAELFERQEPHVKDLLLKTALVPAMTADDAAAVSGNAKAGAVLARLGEENAFVYQTVAGGAFEYHPLFREFLIARAESDLPAAELHRVRHEAARVLERAGRHEAAAEIYLREHDWDTLTALLLHVAPILLTQGRWRPVSEWISAMPAEWVESSPDLLYWKGMSGIILSPPAARRVLSLAYERALAAGDGQRALLACCGVLEAYGTEVGDFDGADRWVDRLGELLPELPEAMPPQLELRLALAFEAVKWCRPEDPLMRRWVERAHERAGADGPAPLILAYVYTAMYYDMWVGELGRCEALVPIGRRLADAPDVPPLLRAAWYTADICAACFFGDFAAARRAIDAVADVSATSGLDISAFRPAVHAYLGICTGETNTAYEVVEQAASNLPRPGGVLGCHCYYLRSQVALARRELNLALAHARTGLQWLERVRTPFPVAVAKLAAAQVLIENGHYDQAVSLDQDAREFAMALGSAQLAWQADLNDGYARLCQGNRAAAEPLLRKALAAARTKLAIVWDISMPTWMAARLAEAALELGIEPDYVREVIRRRGLLPESEDIDTWPWPVRIRSLGAFHVDRAHGDAALPGRKASHQPLALLRSLLALGGRNVDAGVLARQMWPGDSADAENALKTTLHRLRRYLGRDDALLVQDNRLSINLKACWWDVAAFEGLMARGTALQGNGNPAGEFARLAERALALYRGSFLHLDSLPGAASLRERLRQQFYRLVAQAGDYYESEGRWDDAERLFRRALEMEPLSEAFYRRVILCLKRQGRVADALDLYHRCRNVLAEELGARPSAETRALFDSGDSA